MKTLGMLALYVGLIVFAVGGWLMNIIKLAEAEFVFTTGKSVLRIIGVFVPPVGVFMGWFF